MRNATGIKTVISILFICKLSLTHSQVYNNILSYKDYVGHLLNYHPIAKKANLKIREGEAELLGAKGNFDPVIQSNWEQKNFKDKLYYRQYGATLRLPTPLGVDFIGGYENTEGLFLNPERKTDDLGLFHLGVEVNVLQGLLVNERRTVLKQARIFQNLTKNEQQIMLNDLLYDASSAYLIWQQYYYFKTVLTENISIAENYFDNTKQSFLSGEKTAMDTLEAFILYQDAITILQKNELKLTKAKQNIENYLWFKETPVRLQETTEPENYTRPFFPEVAKFEPTNLSDHPIILAAVNKLTYFEIAQRLKREKLKPKLKLKYNSLWATSEDDLIPSYAVDNYKWGFDFSMPLLLRRERANIQKGAVKLLDIELDIQNKRNELRNKIEGSWLQRNILQEQLALLSRNVENYKQLLDGENEKFNYGESSVFLLNKRQEKYINSQLKLIEAYIKQQLELLNFLYYSNQLIYL